MPRTTIAPVTPVGPYPAVPVTALALNVAFTAADVANMNQATLSKGDTILAWNSGASPATVTFTSLVDTHGRTGDISTYALGVGLFLAFRPGSDGWRQANGMIYFQGSSVDVKFLVLRGS